MCVHIHTCMYTCVCMCAYMYICVCIYVYICVYMYIYIYTYMHICVYTYRNVSSTLVARGNKHMSITVAVRTQIIGIKVDMWSYD